MKKKIADMEPGVDVFIHHKIAFTPHIPDSKHSVWIWCKPIKTGKDELFHEELITAVVGRINERGEMEEVS